MQLILCLEDKVNIKSYRTTYLNPRHKSYSDAGAYSFMVGLSEAYFSAFALSIGLGDVFTGLLSTVPLVFGGFLQLLAPRGIALVGSVKKWVMICALIQALSHIPLIIGAAFGKITHPQLLLIVVIYWSAALAAGPAWNYWIGKLIPASDLRHFFATRNMFSQLCALISFVAAGYILHHFHTKDQELLGFVILFSGAFLFRCASLFFLSVHAEIGKWGEEAPTLPPFGQGLQQFIHLKGVGILIFLLIMYFSANTAGPFFSPYMLKALKLNYEQYMFLISGIFIGKIFFGPLGGLVLKRAGPLLCLFVASIIICLTPLLWVFSQDLSYLFSLQVISGCAWATFELSSTLLIFEKVEQKERIMALTFYTLIHSIAVVCGSTLGGLFLETVGPSIQNYWTLFSISTGLRGLAILVLLVGLIRPTILRNYLVSK